MIDRRYEDWGGVYVIYNTINHKFYIGSTDNFRKRWIVHRHLLRHNKHHSPHLQNAWNKYGEAAFAFMRLQIIANVEVMLAVEQSLLTSLRPAYNGSPTATSCKGVKRSEETRAKMRAAQQRPERRAITSAVGKRPKSAEHRANIAASHLGLHPSEETRAKLREASARRWRKPEEREKIRQARLKRRKGEDEGNS
jgi:group I intron endonuclease